MDPLKEIGRKQKAMDRDAYRDALNRPIDAIQQSTPYRLADLIMNGEDADISMAESLIPTLSLQKKLEQGKLPGLADIPEYIGAFDRYNGISRVKPFEHLRDVSTPR